MPDPTTATSVLMGLSEVPAPVVKAAVGLVESLLGKPFKVAGDVLSDQIRMWQWASRVRMAARAQEILLEEKVAARVVPPAFLLPLIEGAGYTDDATLREMWARLLVAGLKADEDQHPMFIHVLRNLSPMDAHRLVEWGRVKEITLTVKDRQEAEAVCKPLPPLEALGVAGGGWTQSTDSVTGREHWEVTMGLTPFGRRLLEVVKGTLPPK